MVTAPFHRLFASCGQKKSSDFRECMPRERPCWGKAPPVKCMRQLFQRPVVVVVPVYKGTCLLLVDTYVSLVRASRSWFDNVPEKIVPEVDVLGLIIGEEVEDNGGVGTMNAFSDVLCYRR